MSVAYRITAGRAKAHKSEDQQGRI